MARTLFKPSDRQLKKYTKINFGCGYDKKAGYLNVDMDPACDPDLLIKDDDFSIIPKNHYQEIYAKDVLEHIPRSQTLAALLDWAEYLKPNGKLTVETSSILGVATQLQKTKKFEDHYGWTICLFGNQVQPGDYHFTGFTETTLRTQLMAAGFKVTKLKIISDWLFYVDCQKVSDWTKIIKDNVGSSDDVFIEKLFKSAFGRKPDGQGSDFIQHGLKNKSMSRRDAAKHLFQSPERLFYTAKKNNL